jgi:hypothetical protein
VKIFVLIALVLSACSSPPDVRYIEPSSLAEDTNKWCYDREDGWWNPTPDYVIEEQEWRLVVYSSKRNNKMISLLSYKKGICTSTDWKFGQPLSLYTGKSIAIKLKKKLYQRIGKEIGVEQYKKNLLDPSPYTAKIHEEDREALKQLGISLPKTLPDPEADRKKALDKVRNLPGKE